MKHINLKTEIPGPKSKEILERRRQAVASGLGVGTDIVVERAEGATVVDVDGNTFLDFIGGIGTLAVGHCPASVSEAIADQAGKLIHMCELVATSQPYVQLCEVLNACTPGDFPKKTLLSNTGAETVENAIKLARAHTGRSAVICFEGAYHGRTLLTMSLTSRFVPFKAGFGPFAPEVYRLPAPYPFRRPDGMTEDAYVELCLKQFENAFITQVDPSHVAAIIIEPVQGEAGFIPMPKPFLAKIREVCDQHGIVMIADEIQCGMGRTGKLFASEHYGIAPDLITISKSLGAGMPIGAITGKAEIVDSTKPGGLGGTFSGSPVACVAAIKVLEEVSQPKFLARVEQIGNIMRETMMAWKEKYPLIGDVRGLGAMMLIEMVRDPKTKEPATEEVLAITRESLVNGTIAFRAGLYGNGIRLLPPLVISDEQLQEGLSVIGKAIEKVAS